MKKTVKKISFILVIAIILASEVMPSSFPVPPVSDVSNQNMPEEKLEIWIIIFVVRCLCRRYVATNT